MGWLKFAMKQKNRSPITDKPLHNPGQSLQEQRDDLLYDKIMLPAMMAWFVISWAAMEWWHHFNPTSRSPIVTSGMALLVLIYAIWRIGRTWPQLRRLKQGIEGEKAVGQYLERLREQGYQIFHDLQSEDFNVDHVIIGPAGIFTIETKTLSKPMRGETKIQFDGATIAVNGKQMERSPVRQAKAQASWVKKILDDYTGRTFDVWPVVVFPSWFIEHKPGSLREMWVLEPKALPKFLANEATILSAEEIGLASNNLSRFIRDQEKLKK